MQWSLLVLILMVFSLVLGQCSFIACLHYEYHFIEEKKTWEKAQNHCRNAFTDLAMVHNNADVTRLKKKLNAEGRSGEEVWIGLSKGSKAKWHWSLPGVEYNKNQSIVDPPEKNCGMMKEQRWQAIPCTQKESFICYDGRKRSDKFHLIYKQKSWREAQTYCREKYTDLVSGRNQLKDNELTSKINQSKTTSWIIGLFRDKWSWSDRSDVSFRNWQEDDFDEEGLRCATMDKKGRWENDNCNETKSFFCYKDKVILIKEDKTWEEALKHCRECYGDLVSITNYAEQRWVARKVSEASTDFVWLGLRYTCTLDLWFWVNDKLVCYKNWGPGDKTVSCDHAVAMNKDHKWIKKQDTEKYNFICALE
ncbi:macrophage mannose receptor 1-like [Pempheris klunzingeri]|uniref:macrophage mannose receptor 1-like n=1 Tax=Pempheris klunzingeri TaxID=3127111 RepID=UPI00397EBFAB